MDTNTHPTPHTRAPGTPPAVAVFLVALFGPVAVAAYGAYLAHLGAPLSDLTYLATTVGVLLVAFGPWPVSLLAMWSSRSRRAVQPHAPAVRRAVALAVSPTTAPLVWAQAGGLVAGLMVAAALAS
jgi:hypothetical protein